MEINVLLISEFTFWIPYVSSFLAKLAYESIYLISLSSDAPGIPSDSGIMSSRNFSTISFWSNEKKLGFQSISDWQLWNILARAGVTVSEPTENPIFFNAFLVFLY